MQLSKLFREEEISADRFPLVKLNGTAAGTAFKVVRKWDNLWDWIDTAIKPTNLADSQRASRAALDNTWAGGTFKEAVDLAQRGWAKGVDDAKGMADSLRHELEEEYDLALTPTVVHDVAGGIVDVGRALAGMPDAMMELYQRPMTRRVVKIVVNNSISFRVKPEVIIRRGALITALVDILENMNIRCEVVSLVALRGLRHDNNGAHFLQYEVKVKRADAHLHIDNLMYMIAHPSSLRRLTFSIMELEDDVTRSNMDIHPYGGYGRPQDVADVDCDVLVPSLQVGGVFNNDTAAQAWLVEILQDQGVVLTNKDEEL